MTSSMGILTKEDGSFYTPSYLVSDILDIAGYSGLEILNKHAIDPACGDGAFLTQMLERYVSAFHTAHGTMYGAIEEASRFIHGIEINPLEARKTIESLNEFALQQGVASLPHWDILIQNAFDSCYAVPMDFVLGNPPYVRIHNADTASLSKWSWCSRGMTDLYIAFFQLGFEMLGKNGILCFITPSSWFSSKAGKEMRDCFRNGGYIAEICDLGHFQPFKATTYTAITKLSKKGTHSTFLFGAYDEDNHCLNQSKRIRYKESFSANGLLMPSEHDTAQVMEIAAASSACGEISVKNGFATLLDSFYIDDVERPLSIPVVKASTGTLSKCIFPYIDGRLMEKDDVKKADPDLWKHFEDYKTKLESRTYDRHSSWYALGRSQGISDVYVDKIAVSSLIRNTDDLKLTLAPSGTGVYGGIYVIGMPQSKLSEVLHSHIFDNYVKALRKYKAGGYYTFSGKDLQRYLNWVVANHVLI